MTFPYILSSCDVWSILLFSCCFHNLILYLKHAYVFAYIKKWTISQLCVWSGKGHISNWLQVSWYWKFGIIQFWMEFEVVKCRYFWLDHSGLNFIMLRWNILNMPIWYNWFRSIKFSFILQDLIMVWTILYKVGCYFFRVLQIQLFFTLKCNIFSKSLSLQIR